MAFGSDPSLILFSCEEIDDNFHVSRNRVSVQAQICVSLVINTFNSRKINLFNLLQELSKRWRKTLLKKS